MNKKLLNDLESNPIIAAVKDEINFEKALNSEVSIIFLLFADIFNIKKIVEKIQESGKYAFIHMDFLSGLSHDETAINFLSKEIKPDGIVSTRSKHIKIAKEKGLYTIQRFFLIDRQSINLAIKNIKNIKPDLVEFMPGLMPEIITTLKKEINIPIIAGGLITKKEHIISALKSGAYAISCSENKLWKI
ncbi:MAG: glycerol uptake operon antiterminator [Fusobacteriaceae bacterium]|jgi:glycerol uptake operon antiterminator|nr:glycerol uptake operon antiterminator [Fusobacteriaceae bacterium]